MLFHGTADGCLAGLASTREGNKRSAVVWRGGKSAFSPGLTRAAATDKTWRQAVSALCTL